MAPEKRVGRREFLATTAAAIGASVVGCQGDDPIRPYVPPDTVPTPTYDPVVAEIAGDTELQIPALGQPATGAYDSNASTGPITSRIWTLKKDSNPFYERWTEELGGEEQAQASFIRPGTYTVKLEVKGPDSSSSQELKTTVNPPSLPGEDYPLLLFAGHGAEGGYPGLYLADPATPSRAHRLAGYPGLIGQTLTWERTGKRFATDVNLGDYGVCVYNLLTDDLLTISRGDGLWMPSWNPKKDIIAAIEMGGRVQYHSEPVLISPDGSNAVYVAGDMTSDEVSGRYPSWDPEGDRLMMAECEFPGLTDKPGLPDKRAAIFEGFWNGGTPTRTQMPTEDQIRAWLDSRGDLNNPNLWSIRVGILGLSISPNGEEAVYGVNYGYYPDHQRMIAKSRLDGTGDIEVLVEGTLVDSLFGPVWSPDGEWVLFGGSEPGSYRMRIYQIGTNEVYPRVITAPDIDIEATTVAWYQ